MNLYAQFATDKNLEETGIRISYGADGDMTAPAFIVARMGGRNRAYQAALMTKMKPYKRQLDAGTLAPEVSESILLDVFVSKILKGWENVTDRNGQPLECTIENAKRLFTELPDLYSDLIDQAQKAETFRVAELDDVAKN